MNSNRPWIIVLTWNSAKRVSISLSALQKLEGNFQILIVDNGSIDNTIELAQQMLPLAAILRNSANLGFAGGNNVGIRHALAHGASHVVLVNDDLALEPDWLTKIDLHCGPNLKIGIAGGCIRFLEKPELVNSTGLEVDLLWRATDRDFMRPFSEATKTSGPIFAMTGGAMWICRQVLEKIGLLDEVFFAYYEDLDFSMRAKRAGFQIEYVANAISYHKFSGSLGAQHPRRYFLLARNHLRTVGLYAPILLALIEIPAVLIFRLTIKSSIAVIRGQRGVALAEMKGGLQGAELAVRALVKRLF